MSLCMLCEAVHSRKETMHYFISETMKKLQSIIDSVYDGYLPKVQISYVVSSNPEAYALKRAERKRVIFS